MFIYVCIYIYMYVYILDKRKNLCSDKRTIVQLLILAPPSWSILEVQNNFAVTESQAKIARVQILFRESRGKKFKQKRGQKFIELFNVQRID